MANYSKNACSTCGMRRSYADVATQGLAPPSTSHVAQPAINVAAAADQTKLQWRLAGSAAG
eukprot:5063852-Karenia_brevis.AAC.1